MVQNMNILGLALAFAAGLFLAHTSSGFVASPNGALVPQHNSPLNVMDSPKDNGASVSSPLLVQSSSGGMIVAALASAALVGLAARSTKSHKQTGVQSLQRQRQLVSLSAFENELGVQAPVGFWDPAGFTADGSVQNFARRRQTEIKHGRISMLAAMGYITPELTGKLPGFRCTSLLYTCTPIVNSSCHLYMYSFIHIWLFPKTANKTLS
jgi:hypothetical protein